VAADAWSWVVWLIADIRLRQARIPGMDNVTHSLAGLVLAESVMRVRRNRDDVEPSPIFRTTAAVMALIAANLPDADLVYSGVGGDRLAYMLHHRGHTHTVVVALVGALLLWLGGWLTLRWRARERPPTADAAWLGLLATAATLSHLLLDWTNSYGVHPFWPLNDRWYYGDAVFIVEPWFWVLSVPALVAASQRVFARGVLSLILLVGLVLAWRVELVSTGAAMALTAGAVVMIAVTRFLEPPRRIALAVVGWVCAELVLAGGAGVARAETIRAVESAAPGTELLDVVVTPLPANPICASVITVERSGGRYTVATARVSAMPGVMEAAACGTRSEVGGILVPSTRRSSAMVRWDAEWSAMVGELEELAGGSCPARAALRFIRVPGWRVLDDSTVILGDLRFGTVVGNGFTDLRVPRLSERCPPSVPPWRPPRFDLFTPY